MRKILSLITAFVLCTTMWGAEVPVTSITVNPGSYDLEKGYKSTLKVTVLPKDATDPSVTWSTSDATIVTVDADGTIHYKKDGVVTITATANDGSNVKGTCTVYAGQFVYNDTPLIEGFVNSGTYTVNSVWSTPVVHENQTFQIGSFSTHPEKAEKRIRITNFGAPKWSSTGVTIDIKWFPANDSLYIVNKQLIGKQNGNGYDLYIAGRGYFASDAANTSHIDRATGTLYLDADYFYYKTSGGSATTYTRKTDILQLEKTPRTLYLNTGGSKLWNQANAKFSAYYWADGAEGKFTDFLTAIEGNADIFVATIPADIKKVIFVRHANDATKAEWDDNKVWNQTTDLDISDDKDMYTITAWGEGTKVCSGEWSKYGAAVEKPKHDYTITVYLPAFCDAIAAYADSARVMGGFDDWSNGIWMEKKIDEDFNDCWYAEIYDVEEGTEFKLRFGTDADWKVQVQLNGANMANEAFGETTDIVLHYDGEGYGFAACPAPVARKEFVFVAGEAADSDPAMFAITWGKDGSNETVKLANKADDIYTAEILETVDSLVLVRCASDATEIIWEGEGTNVWNQTANYELCDTMYFESWVEETNLFAVTCETPTPVETKYYAKNNWNNGDWTWKEMTKVEDLYVLDSVIFGGTGVNINTKEDDADALWFDADSVRVAMTNVVADKSFDDQIQIVVITARTPRRDAVVEQQEIKLQAGDTVMLAFNAADSTLTVAIYGRPAPAPRKEFTFIAGEAADSDPALFAITWGKDGSSEQVKMEKQEEALYAADILATVDSVVLVRCATGATEIIWDGEGKNIWNQTANYALCDTMYFESWVPETNLFAVTCEAPKPVETKYYAKNNWDGGEWSWLEMSATNKENIYMLDSVVFGGGENAGININSKADDADAKWFDVDHINVVLNDGGGEGFWSRMGFDTVFPLPLRVAAEEEPEPLKLQAGDTIMLVFNATDTTLQAGIYGRLAPVARKEFVFVAGEAADSDPAMFAITWGKDGSNETVKLANKADDIYTAEILETVDSLVLVRCASDATEIIWDGEGKNVWNQTANYELCDTMYFESWVPETNLFAVTCEAPKPVETKYYAKNNWDGGEWSWKEMSATNKENIYMLDSVVFGGTGININTKEEDTDAFWFDVDHINAVLADVVGLSFWYGYGTDTVYPLPLHKAAVEEPQPLKLQAGDTIMLFFNATDTTLQAGIYGRLAPAARKEFVFVAGEAAEANPALFAITWGKDGSNETVKLANKADDIYTAEILETVDSLVLVRCASDATEIIWDGEGKNIWNQTANYALCDTMYFESWVEETNLFAVTCEAPQPVETKYYAKNNWNGAEDWSWKEMTQFKETTVYVLDSVVFGGTGININTKEEDTDALWFDAEDIILSKDITGLVPPTPHPINTDSMPRWAGIVEASTLLAGDTIKLFFNAADSTLKAFIIGHPAPVARKEFVFVAGEAAEANPALFAITWGKDGSNETVKLANKADDIYTAEILETVDSLVLVRCATGATEIIWDGEGKNIWNQTANYALCDTMYFESWVPETNLFAVTCEAPQPVATKYYAKNNWNGAAADDWSWLEMSATDQENVYMLDSVVFGGTGVNINDKEDDTDALWFAADAITVLDDLDGLPGPIPPEPRKRDTIPYAPAHSGVVLEAPQLLAGDTIKLFFNAADSTLKAFIVGRPQPVEHKFYVTGNAALVGEEKAWQADAIEMVDYTHTFPMLAAGEYQLKVTDGTWEHAWGYDNLSPTVAVEGLYTDVDGNICFTVYTPNDVTVTFAQGYVVVTGDFKNPQPVETKYYITGNEALCGEKAWDAQAIEMKDSTHTFTAMAAGEYEMKITNGAWDPEGQSWGSAALSEDCSAGVGDKNGNIHFIVETPNNVVVSIANGKVTVTGTFKEEPVTAGITVNVTVPEGTPACYFYGEMSGNTFVEMTKVDDTHYTTTFAKATSIGWGYLFAWEKDNWNTKNAEGDFKVEPVEGVINVEVKAWVTAPGTEYKYTTYTEWQVKYGPAWEWVNMTKQEDGTFTVEAVWGNTGINIASGENPIKQDWYPLDDAALTVAEDVVEGDYVVISLTVVNDETVALGVTKQKATNLNKVKATQGQRFNILGLPVDANYRGVVIMNGQTYLQ